MSTKTLKLVQNSKKVSKYRKFNEKCTYKRCADIKSMRMTKVKCLFLTEYLDTNKTFQELANGGRSQAQNKSAGSAQMQSTP